jgi:hypothetical protein
MTKSLEREMTSVWSCPALKNPNLTDAMSFFINGIPAKGPPAALATVGRAVIPSY